MVGEVAYYQKFVSVQFSRVDIELGILRHLQFVVAIYDNVVGMAQFDQLLIVVEDRVFADHLLGSIDLRVVGIHGEPGFTGRKAGVRRVVPLHGRAGIIAALVRDLGEDLLGIPAHLFREFIVGVDGFEVIEVLYSAERIVDHSEFFALINIRRSLHHVEAGGDALGGYLAILV